MIMFLTFFAISCFTLISLFSVKVLKYFEAAPQAIAFFEKGKDLSTDQIEKIKLELEKTEKLATFKYVSVHEAEAIYRDKNKDDPLLLELVNYKILPPSIEISATNIEALPVLKDVLKVQEGVEDIAFYEDIVASLSSWIKNIRFFGLILILYLLFQSVLIILTITGMKILAKKEEIEIQRLVGASNWFIYCPCVLEGVFYGLVGSFLGWGMTYLLLLYATPAIVVWLGEIALLPVSFWLMLMVLVIELFIGTAVGALGGFISVRRFLRK